MPAALRIECRTRLIDQHAEGAIRVRFELENLSAVPVRVLKRGTPLEGLRSDCLEVRANGARLPYDGKLIKRGAPGPEEFVVVQPLEMISTIIDITDAYAVPPRAVLQIRFDEKRLQAGPADASMKMMGLSGTLPSLSTGSLPLEFETGLSLMKPTEGAKARAEAVDVELPKRSGFMKFLTRMGLAKPWKPPQFTGGNTAQQQAVLKAHQEAHRLVKLSIKQLQSSGDRWFKIWFDDDPTPDTTAAVLKNYRKIQKGFEGRQFTYSFTEYGCGSNDFAWTYEGHSTIWICSAFWQAPPTGMSSKAGTIVHEHAHSSAWLKDHAYEEEPCRKLAKRYPGKATTNAESYEFYAESLV